MPRGDLGVTQFLYIFPMGVVMAFHFNHSNRQREMAHCVFICISLMVHDSEH